MKAKVLIIILLQLLIFGKGFSQTEPDTASQAVTSSDSVRELKALVLDADKLTPLPYANIYVLHKNKGAVSNEKGHFMMDISELENTDTLRFQYIGYKTRSLPLGQIDTSGIIYLQEEIFNLSEILVFGSNPDPKAIVRKILENKDSNYRASTSRKQAFIRERDIQDVDAFKIKYKKSTIPELDRETLAIVEEKFPKNFTSFKDFLGDLYFSESPQDSIKFKVNPIRSVSLKEKDIADLEQMEAIFESVFTDTEEDEYWKIRSGIFGDKVDIDEEVETDSLNSIDDAKKDSLREKNRMKYLARRIKYQLRYSSLEDKGQWEFLHKTGSYEYTLAGGTRVNGEDVYIIDFTPKSSGTYVGRMFVSINTHALIRADYEYAPGKTGRDFHLLGVGYTETQFSGSIYFEKKDDNYTLKYFAYKSGYKVSFDRSVVLVKKRKRFFIDKKLKELKVGFLMAMTMDESIEYLVLDDQKITSQEFADFEQKKNYKVIYVDQFDDKLWKGFSIIEPTQQMKEYKKQELNIGIE